VREKKTNTRIRIAPLSGTITPAEDSGVEFCRGVYFPFSLMRSLIKKLGTWKQQKNTPSSLYSDGKTLIFFSFPTANRIADSGLEGWLLLFQFGLIQLIQHLLKFYI